MWWTTLKSDIFKLSHIFQAGPLKRHCASKGHEPVSLEDPDVKRRPAPLENLFVKSPTFNNTETSNLRTSGPQVSGPNTSRPLVQQKQNMLTQQASTPGVSGPQTLGPQASSSRPLTSGSQIQNSQTQQNQSVLPNQGINIIPTVTDDMFQVALQQQPP